MSGTKDPVMSHAVDREKEIIVLKQWNRELLAALIRLMKCGAPVIQEASDEMLRLAMKPDPDVVELAAAYLQARQAVAKEPK